MNLDKRGSSVLNNGIIQVLKTAHIIAITVYKFTPVPV